MPTEDSYITFPLKREELEFILRFCERALSLSMMNLGINPLKDDDESKIVDLIKRLRAVKESLNDQSR